ncbi:MAG: helix-turn-helix transcriptional regulator [Chthoniobacteraceae bacterium]
MKQRLIEQVGRSARLRVLNELKRTPAGMAVRPLAEKLGMSYMGVKDLCIDLEKRGLLDTWRQPTRAGRPQMLYRLTGKAHELFPQASNPLTLSILEVARTLYGAAAPEKLLLFSYQKAGETYAAKVKGDTLAERAESLARLRDTDGYMSEVERGEGDALAIVEHHSPVLDLLRAFPIVAKFETELFERVLQAKVQREESAVSGLFQVTFRIGDGGNAA